MSRLILDDHLDRQEVLPKLQTWAKVQVLAELCPGQLVHDERVPDVLLTPSQPTFVTIDQDFWRFVRCNTGYCILYFALRDDQQELIPALLQTLFRFPEFRTRAARMGKVARISQVRVDYWQLPGPHLHHLTWPAPRRRRKSS